MRMKKFKVTLLTVLVVFAVSTLVQAQMNGLEIIEKVYNRPTGNDVQSELTMILINSRGDRRERVIKQYFKDYGGEEKKTLFFISPADVRNTSFMNWSYEDEDRDDDQWIYLPALKRVKRISSDIKNDHFMGSDFTYDDLGSRHPSKDLHTLLREETQDGEKIYVVESVPKEEDSIYSRTITWVIQDKWIGLKKEFYDRDGELLKLLTVKKCEKIGDYWILTGIEMHNVQKNHTTRMELKNVRIDKGVSDDMFTERMMRRGVQ